MKAACCFEQMTISLVSNTVCVMYIGDTAVYGTFVSVVQSCNINSMGIVCHAPLSCNVLPDIKHCSSSSRPQHLRSIHTNKNGSYSLLGELLLFSMSSCLVALFIQQ